MSVRIPTDNTPMDDDERLEKFKIELGKDSDTVEEQRRAANGDMRFINVEGGMWEDFLREDFNDTRVKLEFDVVSNFVNRFLGEWDQNRVGVEFKPGDGGKTNDDDAELLNGIYRADFRLFSGQIATDAAVSETAISGYGAMKLASVFEDDEDAENDNQRIEWRPIHNAYNAVFWDRSAKRIDKRDALRCTELVTFTHDNFELAFPGFTPSSALNPDTTMFQTNLGERPNFVFVATRYDIVRKKETFFVYNNLETGEVESYNNEDHELIKDELRANELIKFVRERKIMRQSVEKTVFSGQDILEPTRRISGKWIPIIPFYGYRSYVDGQEWYRGLVRKLKDAGRLFNMQVSMLAENAASAGPEIPIFLREQMENTDIQNHWKDRTLPAYMVVDPAKDDNGNIIAMGPISYLKPQQIDGNMATLLEVVPGFIQDLTGGAPQDTLDPDASGKAIQALIKRENLTTRLIARNIANAILHSGEVYQSMAAEVYTQQRMIRTIGKDGTESETQLLLTVMDEETGKMVESNSLRGKKFQVYADIGPQYETLQEQTVEDLKGMLEGMAKIEGGQQYIPAILAVLLQNITGVGLEPIKDLNRRIMLTQGLVKPETPEEEALVQQAQQPKEDPNQQLIAAASEQQLAEARSLDASSIQKIADAKLKDAQTIETLSEVDIEQQKLNQAAQKLAMEQQNTVLKLVSDLPVGQ